MPGPCWDPLIDRTWVGVICCSRPLLTWTQDHWGNWPLKLYLMKQHTYIFRQLKNSWNVCNHVCLTYVSHDSYVSWLVAFWSKQLWNQSITCPSVLWAEGELSIMEDTEPAGSQGVRGGCGGMKSVPRCAVETTCLDAMTRSTSLLIVIRSPVHTLPTCLCVSPLIFPRLLRLWFVHLLHSWMVGDLQAHVSVTYRQNSLKFTVVKCY